MSRGTSLPSGRSATGWSVEGHEGCTPSQHELFDRIQVAYGVKTLRLDKAAIVGHRRNRRKRHDTEIFAGTRIETRVQTRAVDFDSRSRLCTVARAMRGERSALRRMVGVHRSERSETSAVKVEFKVASDGSCREA
jgi:hypothetical protein